MTYQEELLKTPDILRRVLREKEDVRMKTAGRIIFCGCGTSLYIGQELANLMNFRGRRAEAVSAVSLIENPSVCLGEDLFVFISRSGNSMETVLAMKAVKAMGAGTFYLGCREHSKLDMECDSSRVIEYGNESLILESYSFYAQLLLAWICCGFGCSKRIPEMVEYAFSLADDCFDKCVPKTVRRIICLGTGFYMPLLREMMLKNGEITLLPAENWEILEFRHGPRCWADEHTLIYIMPGIKTSEWDRHVAAELVSYGCPVVYFTSQKLKGAFSVDLRAGHYSMEEVLATGAFITGVATRIGQELGTVPERMRHVVHNVEEL